LIESTIWELNGNYNLNVQPIQIIVAMKKILSVLCIATLLFASCSDEYDDSKLWQNVNDLKDRIASLEKTVQTMNSDIGSIQSIVDAINARDYIVKIEELADKSGYTITFAKGNTITIKHGKDGIDGKDSPIIGIDIYEGIYYWTITTNENKTWLLDNDGNKLKVSGDNGITPIIGVDSDGYWTIDMGNGIQRLKDTNGDDVIAIGQDGTDGDSFFSDVTYDENSVHFTLSDDGTVFSIPLFEGVAFTIEDTLSEQKFEYGETRTFKIIQKNVATISISKPDGWKLSIDGDILTVIAPIKDNTFAEDGGVISFTAIGTDSQSVTIFSFTVQVYLVIYFQDKNFQEYILSNFDQDNNQAISLLEANAITSIDCSGLDITSIAEVTRFDNLRSLNCNNNKISELNVANMASLKDLFCASNGLKSLNINGCNSLTTFYCNNNELTHLNIESSPYLYEFDCGNNKLTSLDVTKNTSLRRLVCSSNQLKSIDVSNNTLLVALICSGNPSLTSLNVKNNEELITLNCSGNNLITLDISNNKSLNTLWCYSNKLQNLDISQNQSLMDLDCFGNQIISLDVGNNPLLNTLSCFDNQLTSLDISTCPNITSLKCYQNPNLLSLFLRTGQTIQTLLKDDHTQIVYK
jgi:hypothetical protein